MPGRPEVAFEAFEPVALAAWLIDMHAGYVSHGVAAGDSRQEAEKNASSALDRRVPGGSPAPGQQIGRVLRAGQSVGYLWVGPAGSDPERWWVSDIVINDDQRGRGLGRQAMLLAEELARQHGATTIGLSVFAKNVAARNLYSSLKYEETAVQMRKPL